MTQLNKGDVFQSKYLIKGTLGQGGMGIVYDAYDQEKQRPCAIKFLLSHREKSKQYQRRLTAEMEMMSRLDHPHIVKIYEFFKGEELTKTAFGAQDDQKDPKKQKTQGQAPYLVMERLTGQSLAQRLKAESLLTLGEALNLIQQALSALSHAHQFSVIHRDLKPENLFITQTEHGEPLLKLLDFGVAKDLESDTSLTASLDLPMIGTPHYMAPEQIRNQKVSSASDLYSIGIIFFEILKGYPPFAMSNLRIPSELTILPANLRLTWLHLNTPPPALEFETELDQIIAKTLAKQSDERPQSAQELSEQLELWAKKHPELLMSIVPFEDCQSQMTQDRLRTSSLLTLEALNEATRTQRISLAIDPRLLDLQPAKIVTESFRLPADFFTKEPDMAVSATSVHSIKISSARLASVTISDKSASDTSDNSNSYNTASAQRITQPQYSSLSWIKTINGLAIFICVGFLTYIMLVSESDLKGSDHKTRDSRQRSKDQKNTLNKHLIFDEQKIQSLINDLSQQSSHLSISQPNSPESQLISEALQWLDSHPDSWQITEQVTGNAADINFRQKLYQAYLYTWQNKEESAQKALIQLYEIKPGQLKLHQDRHLYALTLLRVRLKASVLLRLKLAIKHFSKADNIFLALPISDRTQLDQRYFNTRLKVYLQNKLWSLLESTLSQLKSQQALSEYQTDLLLKSQNYLHLNQEQSAPNQ